MAIEIVDFPIQHGDFPWQNVSSPEGNGSSEISGETKCLGLTLQPPSSYVL